MKEQRPTAPAEHGKSSKGPACGRETQPEIPKGEKNMLYDKVSTDLNFVEREQDTVKFWAENRIFEKSVEQREPTASRISAMWKPGPSRT